MLSSLTLLSHAVFHIVLAIEGDQWTTADAQWAELIGFIRYLNFLSYLFYLFCIIEVLSSVYCPSEYTTNTE